MDIDHLNIHCSDGNFKLYKNSQLYQYAELFHPKTKLFQSEINSCLLNLDTITTKKSLYYLDMNMNSTYTNLKFGNKNYPIIKLHGNREDLELQVHVACYLGIPCREMMNLLSKFHFTNWIPDLDLSLPILYQLGHGGYLNLALAYGNFCNLPKQIFRLSPFVTFYAKFKEFVVFSDDFFETHENHCICFFCCHKKEFRFFEYTTVEGNSHMIIPSKNIENSIWKRMSFIFKNIYIDSPRMIKHEFYEKIYNNYAEQTDDVSVDFKLFSTLN